MSIQLPPSVLLHQVEGLLVGMLAFDLHHVCLGLLITASTLSILIIVARALGKEFEALALEWIRIFKNIRAEWQKPLSEAHVQRPQLVDHTSANQQVK